MRKSHGIKSVMLALVGMPLMMGNRGCEVVDVPPTVDVDPPTVVCPEIYGPVCGEDGRIYDNDCFARAAGVAVVDDGRCGMIEPPLPPADLSCLQDSDCGEGGFCDFGTIVEPPICGGHEPGGSADGGLPEADPQDADGAEPREGDADAGVALPYPGRPMTGVCRPAQEPPPGIFPGLCRDDSDCGADFFCNLDNVMQPPREECDERGACSIMPGIPEEVVGFCQPIGGEEPPVLCTSAEECNCNFDVCAAPDCREGMACPAVCYGVCDGDVVEPEPVPESCAAVTCEMGQRCVEVEVACVRAPCPPVPTCVDAR